MLFLCLNSSVTVHCPWDEIQEDPYQEGPSSPRSLPLLPPWSWVHTSPQPLGYWHFSVPPNHPPDLFLLHGHFNKRPPSSGTLSLDPGTLSHPTQPPLPLADSLFFSSLLGHCFFSGTLVALTFLGWHGTSLRLPYIQQLYHTSWFKPLFPNGLKPDEGQD